MGCRTRCEAIGAGQEDRPRRRLGACLPVVVAAVPMNGRQLERVDIVERVEIDGRVVAAELHEVAATEALRSATPAEVPLPDRRLVDGGLAGRQLDAIGRGDRSEHRELRARRAVAACRLAEVDAGGELDLSADT